MTICNCFDKIISASACLHSMRYPGEGLKIVFTNSIQGWRIGEKWILYRKSWRFCIGCHQTFVWGLWLENNDTRMQSSHLSTHKKPRNIHENIFGQEGAGNAINSSGMTVLGENSSSFGSWYVDNASFCHNWDPGTPSNQLLLGENLVRRLFLETFSLMSVPTIWRLSA